jgi:ribosomal protein L11 methyltransferase
MAWLKLTLELAKDDAVPLETFLEELGALAITFSDAADEPLLEPKPGETPLWQHIQANVLFSEATPADLVTHALAQAFPELMDSAVTEILEDREWLNEWKRDSSPKRYGNRLWVYPWQPETEIAEDQVIVELEPGLAFGTGEHPTTAMCLEWLDQHDVAGRTVMDYGCGSGLLAIAAVKLGALHATGVDIDPQAVNATLTNAEQNAVADRITACNADVFSSATYDIVVANILSGILIDLSSTLKPLLKIGSWLVVTGILIEQARQVQAAYAPDVILEVVNERDGWVLLAGKQSAE